MNTILRKTAMLLILIFSSGHVFAQTQIAFPGAEGYGKYTIGGRGGTVYEVTNLNDSGTGSLRVAVEASGARTVVFKVSGTITLTKDLKITNPNITIAGQTAPGDGICLRKYALVINTNQVIVRYLRVRLGNESGAESDAVSSRGFNNIILDHVSASWSVDETMSLYFCENITIQWCLVSESMYDSNHVKGAHGYGGINGGNNSTSHHNLLAHHSSRNPRMASGCGNFDYRNNVIYNWGFNSTYGGEQQQVGDVNHSFSTINMVANYYKPGPATKPGTITYRIVNPSSRNLAADYGKWYVSENVVKGNTTVTADNWNGGVQPQDGSAYLAGLKLANPWPAMAFNQQTATDAYYSVLDNVGASLPKRDIVDTRVVSDTRNGNATYEGVTYEVAHAVPDKTKICGIIDTQNDVGGWPVLNSTTAPTDTDHDGMPDDWETLKSLNPNNAADRNTVGTDGYTNLEKYLNSIEFTYPVTDYKLTKPTGTTYKLEWRDDYIAEEGFIVERSYDNGAFEVIANLPTYTNNYTDTSSFAGLITYRVVAFNADNTSPRTTSISHGTLGINDKALDNTKINCFPNPFFDELNIEIPISEAQKICVELFDISGKKVTTIANRIFEAGNNSLIWNSSNSGYNLKSGVYIISFTTANSSIKKEVKLIKK